MIVELKDLTGTFLILKLQQKRTMRMDTSKLVILLEGREITISSWGELQSTFLNLAATRYQL